ncbi:MAG: hypothetical protein ACK4SZ_13625 [Allosphingosinicella sp.]|uniref:hypothetical protein n=1 Tax=Allosphingosinicella sp. TaxID=2823234 RepID=UPI0039391C73
MKTKFELSAERPWRNLLYTLTAVTALIYTYLAFFEPGTLTYAPFTIQDDARQFLAWMSRLGDSAAMQGDLIADYWQSVGPPFYRAIYAAAEAIGLVPTVFARLLPLALLALSAWMAWRVALLMTKRPLAAFVAAAFVIGFVIHEDSIYSATPRAFSTPLFLVFLDGLLRRRAWTMIGALFLLGLLYPSTAIVGVTMIGLSRIGWRPFRIDFGLRSWLLGGLAAAAVVVAALPLADSADRWEPSLTVEEALAMPNLGTPEGRSTIVGLDGEIDYLCSARMGVLPEIVPCWSTRWAVVPNILLLLPMLFLAWGAVRRTRYQPDEEPGDLIYVWAIVAGVAWFLVALAVAFSLHLPSRFTQRTLSILEFLAIGQMLGLLLDRWASEGRRRGLAIVGSLTGLFLLVSFATPLPGFDRPRDPDALKRIAAMPQDTIVGGVSDELDFVPALTGEDTLATIEHSIPYHKGYFGPLEERLEASLAAVSSPDPAALSDYARRYSVDLIVVDRAFVEHGTLPERWATVVPEAVAQARTALARQPSALQRRAEACALHRGELVLLDARCLASGSGGPI